MALDQLMRFQLDGETGWGGIFELLLGGNGYRRYPPNWTAMDMSAFTQDKTPPVDRLPPADSEGAGQ